MTLPTDADLNAALERAGFTHCFDVPYPWARGTATDPKASYIPAFRLTNPEGYAKALRREKDATARAVRKFLGEKQET